ncbi:TWiK family of potassium channels protein 7-like [Mizuhopecten yessoensis]|uniref:Potassium channel subfamily K member 18 n=2 Tax=Mizuhopecten yessoensis TaxID=6573 RepID=A0A210QFX8_MIZYE|nr:TWiK family of potassium channels protein 7-like [Mizuhopecten yessoensis]XP_021359331.1 TWiK family of potassium channels protein 7-like [Mizuhopecten yessoensis]OWF47521.1 Potassium channel subfamily K member 18 [Mizuhopecten yessoensis]
MGKQEKGGWCRTIMKIMFSHIGLCGLVALYCAAGGFIFEHLEKSNEEQICYDTYKEYIVMENDSLSKIQQLVEDYEGNPDKSTLKFQLQGILQIYRDNSINIGYDGGNCSAYGLVDGPKYKWSWSGAFFFSVTVISTIGYGHIAPKTFWGRLVCIAYAVLGIPLMLLCLANIGDALADVFRFIYAKIFCCGWCRKKEKTSKVVKIKPTESEPPNWSEKSRIVNNPQNVRREPPSIKDNLDKVDDQRDNGVKVVPLNMKNTGSSVVQRTPPPKNPEYDSESDDDDDDDDIDSSITIPLTVTMVVIGTYIFGGAVLFGLWEGWDTLQSSYFCFITLSTIGFGDVVPGTDFDNPRAHAQLVLGAIYVMFGMAILSMCFTLMQDEIISKCKWIGQKLGLIDKDEDSD